MPRPCGPCQDKARNELDRRLLEMEISHETYRAISNDFSYSEAALKRHKANHLAVALRDIKAAMEEARETAIAEAKERELDEIRGATAQTIVRRLELAGNFFGQLKILRERAAVALELAESGNDLKSILHAVRELRELVRLWAELEGKLVAQPQINILINPQWVELRTLIIEALEPFPEAKAEVLRAIQ